MTDLLPETRAFLRDWLDWVERGAPDRKPYSREDGLCDNSRRFPYAGCRILDNLEDAAFDGDQFPFGEWDYMLRAATLTQHECPKRLAWAREHAAEREKSLSHSEGEEK